MDLLKTILNSITEGVFTVDTDFNITFLNQAAERITGFSQEMAVGKKCFDIFRANICHGECALMKSIYSGESIVELPITILTKDNRRIPVNISTAVLRNDKGEIVGGVETFRDLSSIEALKKEITKSYSFEDIISKNNRMRKILETLPQIAESDTTVLIQGPSGSGKGLLARVIHNISFRKQKPYVIVNCAAFPVTLLESELFGYVKGAFTGAYKDKPGRFAVANGGTILLDEINDMPLEVQVKLLRVIEEKEYEPLGSTSPQKVDVRIIATSNQDLATLVKKGLFREDLYYRLNIIKVELPPLSQRQEDIPLLIEHFINKFNLKMGKRVIGVSPEVMELLMKYDFPGNVRELENIIEHAFVLCQGQIIGVSCLPEQIFKKIRPNLPSRSLFEIQEINLIKKTLEKYAGHRGKTAAALGIDRTTLWRKMKKYKIA